METKDYLKDISDIKSMMSRSSRFISLSGLSGIMAGIYALIGAFLAKTRLDSIPRYEDANLLDAVRAFFISADVIGDLILIALAVLLVTILTGIWLTTRKAKQNGDKIWNSTSKRLLYNFTIPLVTGGIFCAILIQNHLIGLVAPATLIFYGLALVNASKYTYGDVKYLGIANITIGLVATQFIGYGLYFWALGFGVLHIIYGSIMYNKYDRKEA